MGVDIEFTNNFLVCEEGNDDFGFGFEGTGKITGVGGNIVDDNGLARGSGATNTLIEGDAGVRGHGALERAEDKDVAVGFLFEHVETNPIVASELFMKDGDDALHERVGRSGFRGESV